MGREDSDKIGGVDPLNQFELTLETYQNTLRVKAIGGEFGKLLQDICDLDAALKKAKKDRLTESVVIELEQRLKDITQNITIYTSHLDETGQSMRQTGLKMGVD